MQKAEPTQAWKTDYAAMAAAKAIKQIVKWLPLEESDRNAKQLRRAEVLDEGIARRGVEIDEDTLDADYFIEEVEHPDETQPETKEPAFDDTKSSKDGLFGKSAKPSTAEQAISE
jgi:hypothetical protein